MADETTTQNREDIIRISGELKLINQKFDNHINHMSQKIDTILSNMLHTLHQHGTTCFQNYPKTVPT